MTLLRARPFAAILLALLILLVLSGVAYALSRSLGYIPGIGVVDQSAPLRALAEPAAGKPELPLVVRGSERLRRLEDRLDIEFPAEGQATTVNGLLSDRLGRVPRTGDTVEVAGHRLVVLRASTRRAEEVRVEPQSGPESTLR